MRTGQTVSDAPKIVIVGAGPAGLAAARHLVAAGLHPTVVEEAGRPGGQGTRRLAVPVEPHRQRLYGRDAPKMIAREHAEDAVLARCNYRPGTLVWGCHASQLELLGPDGYDSLPYTHLVIAVGATDRVMPIPGWTLPGVFTLGGAQVALKRHASFVGDKVVFAGSSPLMYLAAVQYLRLGHPDVTILDTTPMTQKFRSFPAMLRHAPKTALQGLALMAELRRAKVHMEFGITLTAIEGTGRVERLCYVTRAKQKKTIEADAIAMGHGLRPEVQLAELAGAKFAYDACHRQWFPQIDGFGRAGPGLWVAGDGARTAGADAADAAGILASASILSDLGFPAEDALTIRHAHRRLRGQRRFQNALTRAFAWPAASAPGISDETIICRCERVLAGDIRRAMVPAAGPIGINRIKAITRCGMGRCQGRFCGPALGEIVAAATGAPLGRLRAQAPIRPIPLVPPEGEIT